MSDIFAVLHLFTIGFVLGSTELSNTTKVMQSTKRVGADTSSDVTQITSEKTGMIFDKLTSKEQSFYTVDVKNNSLSKDMYENGSSKNSSVNERSFIYIKQSKKPQWNRLSEINNLKNQFQLPKVSILLETKIKTEEIPRKVSNGYIETNIQGIDDDFLFHHLNSSDSKTSNIIVPKTHNSVIQTYNKGSRILSNKEFTDGQREYFELLKKPLLRPEYDNNDRLENDLLLFSNTPYFHNINVSPQINVQQDTAGKDKIDLTIALKSTVPQNNVKMSENVIHKNNNLDKFIMDTLEEADSLERKDDVSIIHNGFHFCRDCVLREKNLASNRLYLETVCKCGPNLIRKLLAEEINPTNK